jgi:D-alanine-D-alanine ligase
MKKINVLILFGGKSVEHEVSLESAKNIFNAIDKKKYNPILIKIDKDGKWKLVTKIFFSSNILEDREGDSVVLAPQCNGEITNLSTIGKKIKIDVVFPILHGPFGEDGTVQGLLKLANVPFVGASVLGSAVGMDKEVMKYLFRDAGISIGKFITIKKENKVPEFKDIKKSLGSPVFVKPANLGSSVGVSKVFTEKEYIKAVKEAFQYDKKILIEEYIEGREIECSVLGNEKPEASLLGEIKPKKDFYSYKTKYLDSDGAELEVPAKISRGKTKEIQKLAVHVFQVLNCEGMGRVDFFLKENGEIVVNEINTIPGFTKISMYPRLWEVSGISYTKLIDKLITLAIERFKKEQKLKTSYVKK